MRYHEFLTEDEEPKLPGAVNGVQGNEPRRVCWSRR
jgi:hypothetical protein